MKVVNKPLRKKDAMQLVTGQPVYMDDVIPENCLCVKLLRSPHANAIVESINTAAAMKVPGMERIFTWEDVPQDGRRYTQAGQTYPEASPYDRLVIDRHVRFVGDVVAIVAGEDEKCVDKAMRLIKVKYKVLEPLFDFTKAKDNPILVHPEDNWESLAPVGADNKRNLCAHDQCGSGDIDEVLRTSDIVIDRVYHTRACQQAMMETFRTYCSIDAYGRLNVLSSTQIVFHTRRIIANALHIPKSMIRVSKPRIGGGFGATQGLFAVESAVNELAARLGMDPFELREKNIVREGDVMPAYYGQVNTSCTLDRCLARVREMIDWDNKYPCRDMGNGKVRAVGMGMAMQGSGITSMDVGSASLKLNDFGFYTLRIAAADMGTGCDTTLAQIAAEVLECPLDKVITLGADTDSSPYDSGSYASSTIYVTGKATEKCALELRDKIKAFGAEMMGVKAEEVSFDGTCVRVETGEQEGRSVTLEEIGASTQNNNNTALEATVSHTSEISPPPYMVGAAEIELDTETGEISVIDYAACVDCGTPINPNLTRVQAEGGLLQGIGMALTENVTYDEKGVLAENSFLQYKIPARVDVGRIRVDFDCSYEDAGPFGAKSIGEVVINTPLPAIADAVYNATGKRFFELPITPEMVVME